MKLYILVIEIAEPHQKKGQYSKRYKVWSIEDPLFCVLLYIIPIILSELQTIQQTFQMKKLFQILFHLGKRPKISQTGFYGRKSKVTCHLLIGQAENKVVTFIFRCVVFCEWCPTILRFISVDKPI